MNNFTQALLVLACCVSVLSCTTSSIQDSKPLLDVTELLTTLIYMHSNPNPNLSNRHTCKDELHTLNIDFDFLNCKQRTSNELHAEVYAIDGFMYLLLRNQFVIDVVYFEYRDIDDFFVAEYIPSFTIAQWEEIQVVRVAYSSVLPCIDSAKLELRIGSYCEHTSTLSIK